VLAQRCQARNDNGIQCGMFRHQGKVHSLTPSTTILIAEERTA